MPQNNIEGIRKFLKLNNIYDFDKNKRLIEITKLVANIPWGEGRTINEVLYTKKAGTCTGKHLVLKACYDELGITNRPVVCTFSWKDQKIQYPDHIRGILAKGEWEHGHNFLQVRMEDGAYIDVDVTFNPGLKKYGFNVFPESWDGEESTPIAFDKIIKRWDGVETISKKEELIESLSSELKKRREYFFTEFIKWVNSINK